MIVGVGIDIVNIPRIQRILFPLLPTSPVAKAPQIRQGASRFLRRILTYAELDDFRARFPSAAPLIVTGDDSSRALTDIDSLSIARWVGARWAFKEAAYKALYPVHVLSARDVSVMRSFGANRKLPGKPYLVFKEDVVEKVARHHMHDGVLDLPTLNAFCSVSHDGEYLVGQVILEIINR
ncbi:hypothetical protein M427DRAFT_50372 [Gonapodya prolifera JEL478]|uniref:4'-phosphopantetheinyl transferase domain-containing protein n=1 Tax=Gonapodya prolifera (strain JEL478) TaxID=1344416 RepID=A0A139AZ82_GONPJ|nr:hypothetical protein M427DRAFT_50372 [Gonapodya prolifera JEL478]|eukprot:KXS22010.1 hypothetical protein M427DRAFT_50372 [Gonapodya prolifera JEL478]